MEITKINNSVKFDAIPKQINVTGGFESIIKFGENNLAPQMFMSLARTVNNHRAILNSKTRYLSSEIISEDTKTAEFIKDVNNENQSIQEIYNRNAFDWLAIGNSYVEIITDSKKSFLKFNHIDGTKGRLHKSLKSIVFNPNWARRNVKNDVIIPLYPNFIKEENIWRSVVWFKNYEPEFINGIPGWFAGLRQASISGLVDIYNESELQNGFSISGMLFVPNVSTPEDLKKIKKSITEKNQGADKAGSLLIGSYEGNDSNTVPKLIDFRKKIDGNFIDLKKVTDDQLLIVHSWHRALAGFQDNTGFDTSRLLNEYKVALSTYIIPTQKKFLQEFNKVLNDFGYGDILANNKSPVKEFEDIDLKFVWELRKDRGMEFNKEDPAQQKLIYELRK